MFFESLVLNPHPLSKETLLLVMFKRRFHMKSWGIILRRQFIISFFETQQRNFNIVSKDVETSLSIHLFTLPGNNLH